MLIEGKAIQLHPLVCTAFNADFDGDQMAVHVPLSLEAQLEARVLMMSTNNILSPANGKPIIVPSAGHRPRSLLPISMEADKQPGEGMVFGTIGEIHALDAGPRQPAQQDQATSSMTIDETGHWSKVVDTTPGRMLRRRSCRENPTCRSTSSTALLTKKEITNVIDNVYRHCGQKETVIFADRPMALGFTRPSAAGISFGRDDLIVPGEDQEVGEDAQTR